jgi:hypothetical protein
LYSSIHPIAGRENGQFYPSNSREIAQIRSDNCRRIRGLSHTVGVSILVGGLFMLSSCRSRGPAPLTSTDLVGRYVVLAIELGERDPDSLDFSINANHSLDQFNSNPETLDRLHSDALALSTQISNLRADQGFDAARKASLLSQINAIVLRTEQLAGRNRMFDEESLVLFGVVAPQDKDAERRKNVRATLAHLLGNNKDPAAAYARYDAQFVVRPDRLPAVMDMALRQCRALTLEHMALPAGEHVDVEYVFHKPWSAFSHYLGDFHSLIEVNLDYPLTVDRILTLACHEGYPGHHVFNTLRDEAVVRGLHLEEFSVQPTFSPQSYVSEAAASDGPSLVLSEAERLQIERDVLLPLAGLKGLDMQRYLEIQKLIAMLHTAEPSIAREYLEGRLEFVRAAQALERETLMEHGETTLLYLNEYRSYMLSYTQGSDTVQEILDAGHPTEAERWQRYRRLMTTPVVSLARASN